MNREEKEATLDALQERERRRRAAPMLYWRPYPKQKTFLEEFLQPGKRVGVVRGANKVGKTTLGVALGLAYSYGYRFWEVPGLRLDTDTGDLPPREAVDPKYWIRRADGIPIPVPNVGFVVTGLARERGIGQVIAPVLEDLLPPSVRAHKAFRWTRGPQGVVTYCQLPNSSSWIFGSSDQDQLTMEGTRFQWAWCDEPVPPFVFNGIWRGLAIDYGSVFFTLTPLGAKAAWMYQKWVKSPPEDAVVTRLVMRDNPYLTDAAIKEFESNGEWTDAEKAARVHGDFESLGNRVIHTWDSGVHVIPARALPREWRQYQVVDPHHARPPAVIWAKKNPISGAFEIFREYPVGDFSKMRSGGKPATELAIAFRSIEGNDPAQIRIADPRFGKAEASFQGYRATSWADQMEACGLFYDTRVPNIARIETGEQKIVDMLRYDKNFPIGPSNTPKIFVHDCCPNMILAMENYGFLPTRDPTRGDQEKRSEEFKDFCDCLRYLVLFEETNDSSQSSFFSQADLEEENKNYNNHSEW